MLEKRRQHGSPILLSNPEGKARVLERIPLGEPPFNEDRLQQVLAAHPEIVPIEEIEPAFGPLTFLARELPTAAGPVDLVFASGQGYITLVETKLWHNAQARREVVGQVVDYAKELAGWTYDELNQAVTGARGVDGKSVPADILTSIRREHGDVDAAAYADSVSRNLARGRLLLLILGDGIREGVESIASYLQQSPALHVSLALVELGLFRLEPGSDWPLYIQPRTLARTAHLLRAVIEVNAPPGVDVKVQLPLDSEPDAARKTITEEVFFESLAAATSQGVAAELKHLFTELQAFGLAPRWGASSVSFRYPDPGGTGHEFTVAVFTKTGTFYIGWLDAPEKRGYPPGIAENYLRCVIAQSSTKRAVNFPGTKDAPIQNLLASRTEFLNCVRVYIERLAEHARENS